MPKKTGTPIVDRPKMPGEYGLPKDKKGLLPWSYVVERMTEAMRYWICTVTPDARPHATPVDGLWLNDALYFGGSPETRWQRNLTRNASMSVHLENALHVTIPAWRGSSARQARPLVYRNTGEGFKRKIRICDETRRLRKIGHLRVPASSGHRLEEFSERRNALALLSEGYRNCDKYA